MKLTTTQLFQIQRWIGLEKVYYSDIKTELADHIACRIESEMNREEDFEPLLEKALVELNPKQFQQRVLLQTHLSSLKDLFGNIGSPKILAISIGFTVLIGAVMHFFPNPNPDFFEKNLKSAFSIPSYSVVIFGLWKNKSLGNSQVLSTLNTIFLLASLSIFFLRVEWLQWTGFNSQILLFFMTAYFSFILCSGYSNLFKKIRKIQWQ